VNRTSGAGHEHGQTWWLGSDARRVSALGERREAMSAIASRHGSTWVGTMTYPASLVPAPVLGVQWLECSPSMDNEHTNVWRYAAHELSCCELAARLAEALGLERVEHVTVLQDVALTLDRTRDNTMASILAPRHTAQSTAC
jgi:hypothetical protein